MKIWDIMWTICISMLLPVGNTVAWDNPRKIIDYRNLWFWSVAESKKSLYEVAKVLFYSKFPYYSFLFISIPLAHLGNNPHPHTPTHSQNRSFTVFYVCTQINLRSGREKAPFLRAQKQRLSGGGAAAEDKRAPAGPAASTMPRPERTGAGERTGPKWLQTRKAA